MRTRSMSYAFVASLVMVSLILFIIPGSSGADSMMLRASNYQNSYIDGVNATPTGATAQEEQAVMGFDSYVFTNSNASHSLERMKYDSVFYFTGHGGPGYLKFPDRSLIIAKSDHPYWTKMSDYSCGELDDLLLAVYNGCNTANDDPDLGNLLDVSMDAGIDTTIGFRTMLNNDESNYWSDRFWDYMGRGYTVSNAAVSARNDVLYKFGRFGGMDSFVIRGNPGLVLTCEGDAQV